MRADQPMERNARSLASPFGYLRGFQPGGFAYNETIDGAPDFIYSQAWF
jgi:hypothetical protein